jgi:ATP-dependent protease ClpP protease subunit
MPIKRVNLFGEINAESAHEFIEEFHKLEDKRGGGDILVLLDSEGGSVPHALALYDTLRSSPVRTVGLVIGQCLSATTLVLQGCSYRMMYPNASFMMHGGMNNTGYTPANEFRAAAQNQLEEFERFDEMLFSHAQGKISRKEFNRLNQQGKFLSAEEAKKLGFCDFVVVKRHYGKPRKR